MENEYLLVKSSINVHYLTLMQGNYVASSLYFILSEMPTKEREELLSRQFSDLWDEIFDTRGERFEYAESRFNSLSPHLEGLFRLLPSNDPYGKNSWSFPKGRQRYMNGRMEIPIECAFREFEEETGGVRVNEENIISSNPVIEEYLGSNGKTYKTVYFILSAFDRKEASWTSLGETSEVKWVKYSELNNYLRSERVKMIDYVERMRSIHCDLNHEWKSHVHERH